MTTLRRQIALGAAWMMCVRLVDRSIGLASTIILARLLVPADFGVVAMAMGVVALLELFSAFGLDAALIQRTDIDRTHYDTAWTFNLLFALMIGAGLLVLAWPAAIFYKQPGLAWVLLALALAPPIQSLENIGLVAFRRDLNFRAEFLIVVCKRFILFGITVGGAVLLRSYWALVIGIVGGRALGAGLSYVVHPYRPRFSLAARQELFGFSKWMLGTNFVAFVLERAPDVIIGRTLGAQALGLLRVGAELAELPATEFVAPINRAVFPGFSRIASDRNALRREYFAFMGFIALLALPASVGVAAVAHIIVPLVLGPNWLQSIPVVKIMALAGTLAVMQTTNYAVYLAVGKPSRQMVVYLVSLVVLVPSMLYLSSRYGTAGAALAAALSSAVAFPVTLYFVLIEIRASVKGFVNVIWRAAIGTGVMYLALQWSQAPLTSEQTTTMQLLLALVELVPTGIVVYVAVVLAAWLASGRPDSAESTLLSKIPAVIERSVKLFR